MPMFDGFGGFAAHLTGLARGLEDAEHRALEKGCLIFEAEAKRSIGHYQDAAGPFAAWAELADATKQDRLRQGYTEDDPLLRDGTLRDANEHTVEGREAAMGVKSELVTRSDGTSVDIADVAVWQEFGTSKIPPRSFLGGAGVRKGPEVVDAVAGEIVTHLAGGALP